MIQLPKIKTDPKDTEDLCKCRPVCKSRRRIWKGELLKTSEELLLERKPLPPCCKRWPKKVYPNGPCPLFGRTKRITIQERGARHPPHVVRVCQGKVDDTAETPYLRCAEMARALGALGAVKACCAFCECGACCPCSARGYMMHDAERHTQRRSDMRDFDACVKNNYHEMRIMYDKM